MSKRKFTRELAYVNLVRRFLGKPPIKALPLGHRNEPDSCPIALGIGEAEVDTDTVTVSNPGPDIEVEVEVKVRGPKLPKGLDLNVDLLEIEDEARTAAEAVLQDANSMDQIELSTPAYISKFVQDFDNGLIPQLDAAHAGDGE